MNIGGREIGHGLPPFVVAEMSGEHRGDFRRAITIIDAAKDAGADAIKFQLYDPELMATARHGIDLTGTPWVGRSLIDLYEEAHTPSDWFTELFAHAAHIGVIAFSSVFDKYGVDLLSLMSPAFKISSFEAADTGLVRKAAALGKPLIVSTGRASDEQLGRSIAEAAKHTNQIAILYCISEYPADPSKIDFDEIGALRHRYQLPVGFSDHTLGVESAVKAVEAGACIIEKHLTLSRSDGGPDAAFSLEPKEFSELVQRVKHAEHR